MNKKTFYYSENEETEKELIEMLGIPDLEYEKAWETVVLEDAPEKRTTEELYAMVKPLESEEYFTGDRNTREFFIEFIYWQQERARDNGMYYDLRKKYNKPIPVRRNF